MDKTGRDSLLGDFKNESRIHMDEIESAFLNAEELARNRALMDGVFRAAHSIKGTAGFFSLDKIVAVAHELEGVLTGIKNGRVAVSENVVDAVLGGVDCINALTESIDTSAVVETETAIERLKACTPKSLLPFAEPRFEDVAVPFDLKEAALSAKIIEAVNGGGWVYYLDINLDEGPGRYRGRPKNLLSEVASISEIAAVRVNGADMSIDADEIAAGLLARERSRLELLVTSVLEPELFFAAVELSPRSVHPLPKELPKELATGNASAVEEIHIDGVSFEPEAAPANPVRTETAAAGSIWLDVSAVNELTDLANEMILTRNKLLSSALPHQKNIPGLAAILQDMNRLSGEIQERMIRTRMQPVSVIFNKFPRIIRDTAKALGKEIKVKITDGEAALDKYLLDALTDPITQIVKNSADHGIEPPDAREALGKPRCGVITLSARIRNGLAVIEAADDGAGINADALKEKCVERGLATAEELNAMPEKQLYSFIFEPGFSTAKNVTSVSGRGVGMDIVKTNIERLGGTIETESVRGAGTTVRLRMPLTLTLVRTLVIKIDSVLYAIPESSVERIIRVSGDEPRVRFETVNGLPVLYLDGWRVPVIKMPGGVRWGGGGLNGGRDIAKCLLLKTGSGFFALIIDDAVKTEETLVSPLPVFLRNCRYYSNMAVLGSGDAVMVLNAEGIMRQAGVTGAERRAAAGVKKEDVQVIIFKCSGPEYYAVNEEAAARIERVKPEDIREEGGALYADVHGKPVRLIRPESYAPVRVNDYDKESLYLIMLKASGGSAALLTEKVMFKTGNTFSFLNDYENEYVLGMGAYKGSRFYYLDAAGLARETENTESGGKN